MSTRSCTIIRDKMANREEILYRHFDGYLYGAGIDQMGYARKMLKECANSKKTPDVDYVKSWYLRNGDGYEETESVHTDVAYIYYVDILREGGITLTAFDAISGAPKNDMTANLKKVYAEWLERECLDDEASTSKSKSIADLKSVDLEQKIRAALDYVWPGIKELITKEIIEDLKSDGLEQRSRRVDYDC